MLTFLRRNRLLVAERVAVDELIWRWNNKTGAWEYLAYESKDPFSRPEVWCEIYGPNWDRFERETLLRSVLHSPSSTPNDRLLRAVDVGGPPER